MIPGHPRPPFSSLSLDLARRMIQIVRADDPRSALCSESHRLSVPVPGTKYVVPVRLSGSLLVAGVL